MVGGWERIGGWKEGGEYEYGTVILHEFYISFESGMHG